MKTFMIEIPDDLVPSLIGKYLDQVTDKDTPEDFFDYEQMEVGQGTIWHFVDGKIARFSRLTDNAWLLRMEEKTHENPAGNPLP